MAALTASLCGAASAQTRPTAPAAISYSRDIVPLLRTACSGCHNGDTASGGLNLTSYAAAIKGGRGGALLVPGKSADSRFIRYVTGSLKPQMPPGGALKLEDINRLRAWVDAGAKADAPSAEKPVTGGIRASVAPTHIHASTSTAPFVLKRAAPVNALAFSPDGKSLAVGTYREVQFWDVATRTLSGRWTGHPDAIRSLAYSRDGAILAAGGGGSGAFGEVRLWSVSTGKELRAFGDHTDAVNSVAFSLDGARIASASADKTIKIWETATGKLIGSGRDHSDAVWGIDWSPDGKYIASCGADRTVKIWDAATLKRLYSLSGHEDVVFTVEFSADSKTVISASADRTARVWNVGPEGGALARTMGGHGSAVTSAFFAPDGGSATSSADHTVKLWNNGGGNTRTLGGSGDWLYVVRISRDGKLIAAGDWDGSVTLWTLGDDKPIGRLTTAPAAPAAAAINPRPAKPVPASKKQPSR